MLTEAGSFALIKNRDLFLSKEVHDSFVGYAIGRLKRMTAYKFEEYMGEKRKNLVEQFGYDTKNAAHLVRLLRMGIEVLREGKVNVSRKGIDAEDLLDI